MIRNSQAPKTIPWVAAFVATAMAIACDAGRTEVTYSDVAKDDAKSAFMAYVEASNRRDFDKLEAFYDTAADFHWVERGQIAYQSGAEAVASLRSLVEQGALPTTRIREMRVSALSPTSVLLSAQFEFEMRGSDGSLLFAATDWMTVAMVKRKKRWLIAGGHSGDGSH